ncbi:MAG: DUF2273 domain-containing protein [Syntrophomonadaceae bacterium]|jgi:uncharacterized membrane protein
MWDSIFRIIIEQHRGKVIGVVLGLLASLLFISYGFWRSVFIIIFIALGFFIGKEIDEKKNLEQWVKRIFKDKQ